MDYKDTLTNWLSLNNHSALSSWIRNKHDIIDWLNDQTNQFKTRNLIEKVYIVLNGPQPICEFGNPRQFWTFDKGYKPGCVLGNKCKCLTKIRLEKQKATLMEKYGVDSVNKIPGIEERRIKTNIKKYGVDYYSKSSTAKGTALEKRKNITDEQKQSKRQKTKETFLKKYGVEHHMKLVEQQNKVKGTNQKRYGSNTPLQNSQIKEKFKKTLANRTPEQLAMLECKKRNSIQDKYGVSSPSRIGLPNSTLSILDNKDQFISFISGKTREQVLDELSIASHTLYLYSKKYQATELFSKPLRSQFEVELSEFLKSHSVDFDQNNRSLITPLELDFYIPELSLAIECSGLYWHSELSLGKDSKYHYDKFQKCKQIGITLITIFEDDWNFNQSIVKSRLEHILGVKSKQKIYARNCAVMTVDYSDIKDFVKAHHLQGTIKSTINLGLKFNDELVAVMTFGKSRYNKQYEYEILRFCTKGSVVGAGGKLFSYFLNTFNPESVISYSDNCWGLGNMYKELGFELKSETIGYHYTDYKKRYNRIGFQKHKLVMEGEDANLTEWQIMQNRGFDRIWDCGQSLWIHTKEIAK